MGNYVILVRFQPVQEEETVYLFKVSVIKLNRW